MAKTEKSNTWKWIVGGAVAFFGFSWWQRKNIMDVYNKAATALTLVTNSWARPYTGLIYKVAHEVGVDPLAIYALGERESGWGVYLDPKGPSGVGDKKPRPPALKTWGFTVPPTGGWGLGLMQLDYKNGKDINWRDPETNIRKGAQIFKASYDYMAHKGLTGTALLEAAFAGYNHGPETVYDNVAQGLPADTGTTQNYASGVVAIYNHIKGKMNV